MKEGWICPRCKKVNAPFIPSCDCQWEDKSHGLKNTNLTDCIKGFHQWECCGVTTAGSTYICRVCGKTKTENYDVHRSNITISSQ